MEFARKMHDSYIFTTKLFIINEVMQNKSSRISIKFEHKMINGMVRTPGPQRLENFSFSQIIS